MDVDVTLTSDVAESFRVAKVRGQFDLPPGADVAAVRVAATLPLEGLGWRVGLITGASGTGKSTIARELWPKQYVPARFDWPPDQAVVDGFPEGLSATDVTGLLTSVGFGSPPAWLRPYAVLSTGQQHRADLARALANLGEEQLVAVDEFTSTVDRTVAKAVSVAVARHVRRAERQIVLVTCHKDVAEWATPDWVYDTDRAEFLWGSVHQRPPISLDIREGLRSAWPLFRGHHYLSGDLSPSARVFLAYVTLGDDPERLVGFFSLMPVAGSAGWRRGHRTVVLPDFQGLGIGNAMIESVAEQLWERERLRFRAVTSAPALVAHRRRHPEMWRLASRPRTHGPQGRTSRIRSDMKHATNRLTTSWVYLPQAMR